jgi:hypothetical protein
MSPTHYIHPSWAVHYKRQRFCSTALHALLDMLDITLCNSTLVGTCGTSAAKHIHAIGTLLQASTEVNNCTTDTTRPKMLAAALCVALLCMGAHQAATEAAETSVLLIMRFKRALLL